MHPLFLYPFHIALKTYYTPYKNYTTYTSYRIYRFDALSPQMGHYSYVRY